MVRLAWGRSARLYVAAVEFDEAGAIVPIDVSALELVRLLKDVGTNDEAATIAIEARDLSHKIYDTAGKEFAIEGEKVVRAASDDAADAILADAYENGSLVWAALTRDARDVESGAGILICGRVFGWPDKLPEAAAAVRSISIRQADDGELPTRIETPYTGNAAPVITVPSSQTATEDTNKTITGTSIADDDGDDQTVTIACSHGAISLASTTGLTFAAGDGTADATMEFSGTLAHVNTALATLTYLGATNYNGSDTITITADDGNGGTDEATIAVTVNAVNDAPVITTSGGATSFTEDGGAVVVDSSLTITDADSSTLSSATVEVLNFQASDVLAYTTGGGVSGSWNGSTHKLTLTAGTPVTLATMRDRLRTVTFNSTSQNPNTTQRNLEFKVYDGAAWSSGSTKHVDVTAVNDPPTIVTPADAPTFSATIDPGETIVTDLSATDPESDTITFTATGGADAALFTIGSGVGTEFGLLFVDPAEEGTYVVQVTASDGHGGTDVITFTITVAITPPTITSDGGGATGSKSITAGTDVAVTTVTATGSAPIVFSLGTDHDEASFAIDSATGDVTGTITAGTYTIEVIATNDGGSDSQLLTLTATGGPPAEGSLRFVATVDGDEQIATDDGDPQALSYATADGTISALIGSLVGHLTNPNAGDVLVLTSGAVEYYAHVKSLATGVVNTHLQLPLLGDVFTAGVDDVVLRRVAAADFITPDFEAYDGEPAAGKLQYAGTSIFIGSDGGHIDAVLGALTSGDTLRIIFDRTGEPQAPGGVCYVDSIALSGGVWTIDAGSGPIDFDTATGVVATIFKVNW